MYTVPSIVKLTETESGSYRGRRETETRICKKLLLNRYSFNEERWKVPETEGSDGLTTYAHVLKSLNPTMTKIIKFKLFIFYQ